MCGFAGVLLARSGTRSFLVDTTAKMAARLAHRGPDGEGVWVDASAGFGLGHRRLAIRDLTETGSQPMISACSRWILAFNGEVYNDRELRSQLDLEPLPRYGDGGDVQGDWRGTSDTETLLAAISEWGLAETLRRTEGMFAFALWDRADQRLTIARDRFGEKPLYYGAASFGFAFGSELKALRDLAWLDRSIDHSALAQFLSYGYIAAPASIYRGILKLPAGTYLEASRVDVRLQRLPEPKVYWSAVDSALRASAHPFGGTRAEVVEELHGTLARAVQRRMVADVPVGAFLSGGVDSSIAVAMMRAHSNYPVKTFTISMGPGHDLDESAWAAETSRILGTQHECHAISSHDVAGMLPSTAATYDEPFADSSQLATLLVSQIARKSVGVCLTGDGGDELFGGYSRYAQALDWSTRLARIPRGLRERFGRFAGRASHRLLDVIGHGAMALTLGRSGSTVDGERLQKLALSAGFGTPLEFYMRLSAHWKQLERVLPGTTGYGVALSLPASAAVLSPGAQMMLWDALYYLPDNNMVKVDRASMAVGLECRTPFLAQDVFDFAWRMPDKWRIDSRRSKPLLRDVLARYLPQRVVDRPKMGFCVPLAEWLRGPLRPWVEAHLSPQALNEVGLLNSQEVSRRWNEHLHGHRDWHYALWTVVTLQAWAHADRRREAAIAPTAAPVEMDVVDLSAVRARSRAASRRARG